MVLKNLFKKTRLVGLVGGAGEGKSSFGLNEITEIKNQFPNLRVCVIGAETSLHEKLGKRGIEIIKSKEDILDLKIRDAVIFIEEFGDLFSIESKNKQLDQIKRFFNRIDHLNDYILISSAREKFWNSFMNGLVKNFIVKSIEYDSLVNGTVLKRKIKSIVENTSDYRLDIPKDTFYILMENDIVRKDKFKYNSEFDSKKQNTNPFLEENCEKKVRKNCEKIVKK